MFCKSCGQKIPEDSKYCPECGKAQGDDWEKKNNAVDIPVEEGKGSAFKDPSNGNTGSSSLGAGLSKIVDPLSNLISPLQNWLYDKGDQGKWIVVGIMLLISLLPILILPSIFRTISILLLGIYALFSIFIQYLMTKIPLSFALKKLKISLPLEEFRINVLLLMVFGQIFSLFTSVRNFRLLTNFRAPMKGGGVLGSILILILTTIVATALFWKNMGDEEEILPFSGYYILMRFIVSMVVGILGILLLGIIGALIMKSFNSYF
ncbi:MAG: zinc ribbon domain-containing protein [Tissierellia bacterium]|nr:zinc ribbon domain-containing protein [Tissierellia bacterium]